MTTRVLLVAHGPTAATREARFPWDEELDALPEPAPGASGAARWPWTARATVLTSAAQRCRQSAGDAAAVDVRLDDWDLGRWAGHTPAQLAADATILWRTDPDYCGHGGESLHELLARVDGWLGELTRTGESAVVAVTHPAVLRAASVSALRAPASSFWRIDVEPGAAVAFSARAGRWNLRLS